MNEQEARNFMVDFYTGILGKGYDPAKMSFFLYLLYEMKIQALVYYS